MSATVKRNDVGMYLRFAKSPIPSSLEFSHRFIVDFSPDDDVIGLEFLYPDDWHIGCEPEMLAFGVFGSALLWLGYNYAEHGGEKMLRATLHKAKQFIDATDLELQAVARGKTGLTIADADGKPLLCADLQYQPRRLLKTTSAPESASGIDLLHAQMAETRSVIKHLSQSVLPDYPGAVGVAVAFDQIGALYRQPAVAPGLWIDWPEARLSNGSQLWAHIAVIPPHDRVYPWLPDGFLPSRGAVNAAEPSTVLC